MNTSLCAKADVDASAARPAAAMTFMGGKLQERFDLNGKACRGVPEGQSAFFSPTRRVTAAVIPPMPAISNLRKAAIDSVPDPKSALE